MKTPLSKKQKAVLSQMASKAYKLCGRELGYDSPEEYRHAVCLTQRGVAGLTACSQQDYIPLYNHFAAILDMRPIHAKTPHDELARALWCLRDALHRFEFAEGYACAILRDRGAIGDDLDTLAASAGAEVVQQCTYTVINRGRARLRKAEGEHDLPMATELHTSPATLPPGALSDHFNARLATPSRKPAKPAPQAQIHANV